MTAAGRSGSGRVAAALAAVLAGGCSLFTDIPRPVNDPADPPLGADQATALVVTEWAVRLGEDLPAGGPDVLWFGGDCLEYSGRDDGADCANGMTWTVDLGGHGSEVHLTLPPDEAARLWGSVTAASSLSHEALHWAFYELGCGRDTGHAHPLWAAVPDVQRVVAAAEAAGW